MAVYNGLMAKTLIETLVMLVYDLDQIMVLREQMLEKQASFLSKGAKEIIGNINSTFAVQSARSSLHVPKAFKRKKRTPEQEVRMLFNKLTPETQGQTLDGLMMLLQSVDPSQQVELRKLIFDVSSSSSLNLSVFVYVYRCL